MKLPDLRRGLVYDTARKILGELRVGPYVDSRGQWAIIKRLSDGEREIIDCLDSTTLMRFEFRYTTEALASL